MRATELITIAASLLAVASGVSGALYFLLKSGFRLGRDIESNRLRLLSLEQRTEDLEGKLESLTNYRRRKSVLQRETERETPEGMEH